MTEKEQMQVGLLLPGLPDLRDACVERLRTLLKSRKGIEDAHAVEAGKDASDTICVHFDADVITVGEVRQIAQQAGAELAKRFGHLLLKSGPMHAREARSVEQRAGKLPGVLDVAVSPSGTIRAEFDRELTSEETLSGELSKLSGQTAKPVSTCGHAASGAAHEHSHGGLLGEQAELIFAIMSGVFLLAGWLISFASGIHPYVSPGLYIAAYLFGGFFTLREAIQNIWAGRFEIDFLMLVAAAGAAALGEWGEGALLLFLFSIGHALEHYAMGRARRAIEALAKLAPQTAVIRRGDGTEEVPVEQLKAGDIVIVKPNERIAADGFVVVGEGSINQAPITGESVPVDKRPVEDRAVAAANPEKLGAQYRVFAGTINQSGAFEIQVTKLAAESTLARVVQMVNEAETQKSPTQRFTDKFERYFVPAVLAFVVLLLFAWLVIDEPFSASFYRAMAVLVAASPCALAISTPSAVLSGVARAARGGVLVKGGAPLENLGTLRAIAFDKTGTLTEGKPKLTDVVGFGSVTEEQLLRVAVAVESLSDHPLAAAVVTEGKARLKETDALRATEVQSITGRGVRAAIDGEPVYIGKEALFSEIEGPPLPAELKGKVEQLRTDGRTTMIVRWGAEYLGALGLMDTPRPAAAAVIERLRKLGIERLIMISGDSQNVADAVAKQVGLDEAWGDLMPEDKVQSIKKLGAEQAVAMVGDGVNDAPAMANATVGIAMGAAGSDVALETADVALMADDLRHLPFAVGLSRQTSSIIRQNLWFSLGMVAFLVPATVVGLGIGPAVLLHEGSTLLVVFNALRLLAYREASDAAVFKG